MSYIGDFRAGQTVIHHFTLIDGSGVGATLTGSPAISIYRGTSTSETTSGVTTTVNHDGATGAVALVVDTAASAGFYVSGANYFARITAGFVSGATTTTSAVGYTVMSFSLENRSHLMPTVSGRTLSVSASGRAAGDLEAVTGNTTAAAVINNAYNGSSLPGAILFGSTATATTTSITVSSGYGSNVLRDSFVVILSATTGSNQSRTVSSYTSSTGLLEVDRAWDITPTGTIRWCIIPNAIVGVSSGQLATSVWTASSTSFSSAGTMGGLLNATLTSASFPSNFTSMLITTSGYLTVGTFTGTSLTQITTQAWSNTASRTLSGAQAWNLTGNITGNLIGSVNSISGVTFPTNFSTLLITASGFVTAGTITATGYTQVQASVWGATATTYSAAGTMGEKMNAAGSAGDPWTTALPGSYSSGQAGFIIGNYLDTSVGSRMATFSLPTNFSTLAITASGKVTVGTNDDKTGYTLTYTAAQAGDQMALTTATQTAIAERVLKYDYSIITGEASRSLINATRLLRNKWTNTGGTLTVTKEDDSTTAWTASVSSTAGAEPVTSIDPA